jgi:hypothetical protein
MLVTDYDESRCHEALSWVPVPSTLNPFRACTFLNIALKQHRDCKSNHPHPRPHRTSVVTIRHSSCAPQVRSKHGTTSRFATSRIDAANTASITALCLDNKVPLMLQPLRRNVSDTTSRRSRTS